jgi:hypothetical protein
MSVNKNTGKVVRPRTKTQKDKAKQTRQHNKIKKNK